MQSLRAAGGAESPSDRRACGPRCQRHDLEEPASPPRGAPKKDHGARRHEALAGIAGSLQRQAPRPAAMKTPPHNPCPSAAPAISRCARQGRRRLQPDRRRPPRDRGATSRRRPQPPTRTRQRCDPDPAFRAVGRTGHPAVQGDSGPSVLPSFLVHRRQAPGLARPAGGVDGTAALDQRTTVGVHE